MAKAGPPAGATVTYQQRMTRCGKADCPRCAPGNPGHGPYWYATWRQDGRQYTSYVGKQRQPKDASPAVQEARSEPAPAVGTIAPLRVRTLGAFQVWRGELPIPTAAWSRRKAASLFKALLGAPGQRLHREQAADLLWPETDAGMAANNLRATLHLLRKIVDAPGQPQSYLRTEGELLALSPSPTETPDLHWWDAAAFERQATAALASEDAAACKTALILYRGEYLPDDRYEPWAADRRTHLHQQRQALLLHLAMVHGRQGAHADSEQCLRAVLESDPCHERAARALLRLLGRTGQQAEAARVYQKLAAALREELGMTPSAKTEALRATLLTKEASPPTADAVPHGFEAHLPGGTVTFLMTDIDADTALWEQHPVEMQAALARHDTLLAGIVARHGGRQFKGRGERIEIRAVFDRPRTALAAACALQQALLAEPWPSRVQVRVRAGLHSGEADVRDGDYHGIAATRCARLRALGHGGQILLSQTTADLVRDALPEGVRLRALGAHQLKGMERLEEIYQLLHPALPAEFPPLRSPQAPRNNLPAMLTSFIGRERVQEEVRQMLGTARLLTLIGVGGVGKTRLAVRVAEDMLEEYEDGVWLVELASLMDPALTTQAVATVLGLREEPGCPLPRTIAEHLQSKQALLVLDNCEHLIGVCAEIVTVLLRNCPRLTVLATSREALGIAGERTWRIPSLTLPDPRRLPPLERLAEYEAIRLFRARGQVVRADFALTERNAWAVVALCRRLDGLPLAIELAAARLAMLSVEQIVSRLDDCFRLLTGGSRTALPRQQTLRAALDWSHQLLSVAEQALFRRLSVFAGGWTLEAAEEICADPASPTTLPGDAREVEARDMLDLLTALGNKSLLQVEEAGAAVRFRLLETVRAYGSERLGGGAECMQVQERHRDWYLALAEAADAHLKGAEQAVWLQRLEAEHDNLCAALARPAPDASGIIKRLRLTATLVLFWQVRGYLGDGQRWLTEALAAYVSFHDPLYAWQADLSSIDLLMTHALDLANGAAEEPVVGRVIHLLGNMAWLQADPALAEVCWQHSLRVRMRLDDQEGVAWTWNNLGVLAQRQSEGRRAQEYYRRGLAICERHGYDKASTACWNNLGTLAVQTDDLALAEECYRHSMAIKEHLGDLLGIGAIWMNMGNIRKERGEIDQAEDCYRRSLAIAEQLKEQQGLAYAWRSLGMLAIEKGQLSEAEEQCRRALAISERLGSQDVLAECLNALGSVAHGQGEYVRAAECHQRSLAIKERFGNQRDIAIALICQGHVALDLGLGTNAGRPLAAALYRRARHLARRAGSPKTEADATLGQAYALLGVLQTSARRLRAAGAFVAHAHALAAACARPRLHLHAALAVAELHVCRSGDRADPARRAAVDEAAQAAHEALRLSRTIQDRRSEALALRVLGRCARAADQPADALIRLRMAADMFSDMGAVVELARTHLILAGALVDEARATGAPGVPEQARIMLADATRCFITAGATWDAAQADRLAASWKEDHS